MSVRMTKYNLWPEGYSPEYASNSKISDSKTTSNGNSNLGKLGYADSEAQLHDEAPQGEDERGQWGNKAEFVLSCIGLSVGLGNVWRFPYLAYEHGGAAFLIAYIILQLLIGKPMYFMELVMGQFSGSGPTKVWRMNPAAKGVGISMCIISLIVAIYYNIIMAYTLIFFFSSMQGTLPWTQCKQEWIDEFNCVTTRLPSLPLCTDNVTVNAMMANCSCTGNSTIDNSSMPLDMACKPVLVTKTAAELFFYKEVIQKSAGVYPDQMGAPLYKLALCLLLSWIVVVFCLIKGIKSSGKVVYFTATFPYVILLILLVRGSLLDGALEGVKFFIIPDWEKLADVKVWVAAAGQMFFSLSVSFGGIIMFGSYNKFHNKVYYDSLLISVMDLITSVIAGFVVFTTFGGMAKSIGKEVKDVAQGGYGLAFVVYPEALSNLPPSQLWSVLFFFMLFTLGLDSEFGLMETVLTCIQDEFPKTRRYKSAVCVGLSIACFFLALPCTCPGGDYVVSIMDHYGADFSVLILSCIEVISVMWVYGVMNFLKDIEYMLGSKPHGWPYWVFCWTISAPILIALMFLYRMVEYSPPKYDDKSDIPQFAQSIGWALLTLALCPVPLAFFWRLYNSFKEPGVVTIQDRINYMFKPTPDWGPNDGSMKRKAKSEPKGIDNPALSVEDKSSKF